MLIVLFLVVRMKIYSTLFLGIDCSILINKEGVFVQKNSAEVERCATVATIQKILGGKWKIEILYYISLRTRRFGELQRQIGNISQSTLTKQLRELEADGFVSRYIYQEIPPKVEYSLTDLGKSFIPVIEHMKQWGEDHLSKERY